MKILGFDFPRRHLWISLALFLSFFSFFCLTMSIGGDAVSGDIYRGRFYVKMGGTYTQVSRGVYILSASLVAVMSVSIFVFFVTLLSIFRKSSPMAEKMAKLPKLFFIFIYGFCGLTMGLLFLSAVTCIVKALFRG